MNKLSKVIIVVLIVVILASGYLINEFSPMLFAKAAFLQFDESEQSAAPISWFTYTDEYLAELRKEYALDKKVANCSTDYEKVQVITNWVHNLWKHDGNNTPAKSDPLFILREVEKGQRFRCVEYGVVISGCLQALGIQARTLGLKTADVETRVSGAGHVATEVFLPDLHKWILVDGQWNAIPELNGTPLNAVELQAALAKNEQGLKFRGFSTFDSIRYKKWITPYLYYLDVWAVDHRIMLGPVGAKKPAIFQVKYPLSVQVYTHSPKVFYAEPR